MAERRFVKTVEIVSEYQGKCVECADQPWEVFCESCGEEFCEVCFGSIHRSGNRAKHVSRPINSQGETMAATTSVPSTVGMDVEAQTAAAEEAAAAVRETTPMDVGGSGGGVGGGGMRKLGQESDGEWFRERTKHIPLRLTGKEREMLVLLQSALNVSEYTDKVDILTYRSKTRTIVQQLSDLYAIVSGLVVASDLRAGGRLLSVEELAENAEFFQTVFEIGRRFKIMNPDKMRTEYGKLIHLLMDSQKDEVEEALGFSIVSPIQTVHSLLEDADALDILDDEYMATATTQVSELARTREELDADIAAKRAAMKHIVDTYGGDAGGGRISEDELSRVILSIADNHAFLASTRDSVEAISEYLQTFFSPDDPEQGSLAIRSGSKGSRLTHSHATQYTYVLQTFELWREVQHDFFKLWHLAETDLLLKGNWYRLRDTGQGLNRMQAAPNLSKLMHSLLSRTQKKMGGWVGSAAIHLGDHNVPNALFCLDKYNQVPRILNPIINAVRGLEEVCAKEPEFETYVTERFGGVEAAQKRILRDFFRHGFNGSGAKNFFDAGSCIDGRLTSSWNWCSTIEKKSYFPLFLSTGFIGFDGQF